MEVTNAEQLEELIKGKPSKVKGYKVTRYGEKKNRVMLVTLGEDSEHTSNMMRLLCLLLIPRGYEIIRIDGEDFEDKIIKIYDAVSEEKVLPEVISYTKSVGIGKKKIQEKYLEKKLIYSISYKDCVPLVMKAFGANPSKYINRFYFISPSFDKYNYNNSLTWLTECEVLVSREDDKDIKKRFKQYSRKCNLHVNEEIGSKHFSNQKDLLSIQVWLEGARKAKYGNSGAMIYFLAAGVFLGYIAENLIFKGASIFGSKLPIGIILGVFLAIVAEEIWRHKKWKTELR